MKGKNKTEKGLEFRDVLALALVTGAGIGGYYLWKYLKEKPEDIKKGFNISKISWSPEEPIFGGEIKITVIGKNNTEQGDCYCKIIDLDTQQQVFYDHAIVDKGGLKGFIYTTIMPSELRLRIETGKIIEEADELHSFIEITIKSFVAVEIKSTSFAQKI